ncbi:DUF192 domain-containing protein [Sphingomonas sp. ac-8]|uniref:DUF192 domain-containing protein n=1 Tax=Sphingomonas sp. ac-8 TaxID=3242977 RepID=UPI003A80EB43
MINKSVRVVLIAAAVALSGACTSNGSSSTNAAAVLPRTQVTVESATGAHRFDVEVARSAAEQANGLMYRTNIPENGGMLFAPYPAGGGAPRVASFWMKNTPSPLDILFIRPDGTVATLAENTIPFSEAPVSSREPVSAVLELRGGRAAELGIAEGDTVRWKDAVK